MEESVPTEKNETPKEPKALTIKLSWKLLSIVLAILLIGLVVYTRPWQLTRGEPRTITITGESTIKKEPDSFVFYPSFQADSIEEITAKSNEIVAGVKALGLGDAGIQTNVSSYEDYGMDGPTGKITHTLSMTLAVEDKELAQKIQDYLVSAGATGQITPTVGFTNETEKALKDEATTKAVEDAKKRAEQTAQNLGVKIVRVIKITEPEFQDGIYPIASREVMMTDETASLGINAGESEYSYSVIVEFEVR